MLLHVVFWLAENSGKNPVQTMQARLALVITWCCAIFVYLMLCYFCLVPGERGGEDGARLGPYQQCICIFAYALQPVKMLRREGHVTLGLGHGWQRDTDAFFVQRRHARIVDQYLNSIRLIVPAGRLWDLHQSSRWDGLGFSGIST